MNIRQIFKKRRRNKNRRGRRALRLEPLEKRELLTTGGPGDLGPDDGLEPYGPEPVGEMEDIRVAIEGVDWGDAWDVRVATTQLTGSDSSGFDRFGQDVAIWGDRFIVGAPDAALSDGSGSGVLDGGKAYIYHLDGTSWIEEAILSPLELRRERASFGGAVSISGDWAVVGATDLVEVYHRVGSDWVRAERLGVDMPDSDKDGLGSDVSVSGDRAIIAKSFGDAGYLSMEGVAYVVDLDGDTWSDIRRLPSINNPWLEEADPARPPAEYPPVAISGNWAFVGSPDDDQTPEYSGGEDVGAVYVYEWNDFDWEERQKLHASEPLVGEHFGASLSVSEDRLLVGAPAAGDATGAAYVFQLDSGSSRWVQQERLTASDTAPTNARFGAHVSILGARAVVQAESAVDDWDREIYVFSHDGSHWVEQARHVPPHTWDVFGAVAAGENVAIVGAPNAAAVFLLDYDSDAPTYATLASSNGAHHTVAPGVYLGARLDVEPNGRSGRFADGDDLHNYDDEDGVDLLSDLVPGSYAQIDVVASTSGFLDVWVDFDANGDWEGPEEQIFPTSEPVFRGTNRLTFPVPDTAVETNPHRPPVARFRFSTEGGLPYYGPADNGEVEDYAWSIVDYTADGEISGIVWRDAFGDGIRDVGEPGMGDVTVELYSSGALIATQQTCSSATCLGAYQFSDLRPGEYVLKVPAHYQFSPQDQGTDDTVDSDVDRTTGEARITLLPGHRATHWDAGLEYLCQYVDVTGTRRVSIGAVNNGIAAQDGARGRGFIMYSEEDVFSRFASHAPHRNNSNHLIAVKYEGCQWYYDDNGGLHAFEPRSTDVLLAEVDFERDTVTSLEGVARDAFGIAEGFAAGDLNFFANRWRGGFNTGEFTVEGTYFITHGSYDDGRRVSIGAVNNGIAARDRATGRGFIMYSEDPVHTRFASHAPHGNNSDHLIAVVYEGCQWYYDDNGGLRAFEPRSTDVLLAEVDFERDTITSLEGVARDAFGIAEGFAAGDLNFFANRWRGGFNAGEFTVEGTYFITHGSYDGGSRVSIGAVNNGIAAQDGATGRGFIMYSEDPVHTRFASHAPHGNNSDHLIAVVYEGCQWYYDDNGGLRAFEPRSTDVLLAEVDFERDTITSLEGVARDAFGIAEGFAAGDLNFFANRWRGGFNAGEFTVEGTFFVR